MSNDAKKRVLYSCSGAADVGQIADMTARKLAKDKFGSMSCLAGIGAGLPGFLDSAKETENIIIDGCPVCCGKRMFENQGLPFTEIILTQQGLVKGSTPPSQEAVNSMAETIQSVVSAS